MADPAASLISLVIPVYNEEDNILPLLQALKENVSGPHETLLVYDFDEDTTLPPARRFGAGYPEMRLVKNELGRGALNALKTGLAAAEGDVVIVTMADLSDDVSQIDDMASLVRGGAGLVAGSRYMRGGKQLGGPPIKSLLSRAAGVSLWLLTGIGTHDATNNYKAYSRELVDTTEVESSSGFELGLEMATKAYLGGYEIAEIPTTWTDRASGESRFQALKWMPSYLRWYFACLLGSWSGRARRSRKRRARLSRPRSARVSTG